MKLILCVDDRYGLLFNHRRQSRDREVTADIIAECIGRRLLIEDYSQILFKDIRHELIVVSYDISEEAEKDDCCFIERKPDDILIEKADELILYFWNRKYPKTASFKFDNDMWEPVSEIEFRGRSHDKITKRRYRKRG